MAQYVKNLARGVVAVAPSPATSGTSLELESGQGAWMPPVPFVISLSPSGEAATPANTELAVVEAISVNKLSSIKRAQFTTSARSVKVGDIVTNPILTPSVLSYGADPTGTTDSTTAFEKAAESSNAIYAPVGTYLITGTVELGGKALYGDGIGATKFTKNSLVASMFTVSTGRATLRDFAIENLKHEPTSGSFILITAPGAEDFAQVTVQNIYTNYAFNGIEVTTSGAEEMAGANLTGIWQDNYKGRALYLHDGADTVTVSNFNFIAEAVTPGGFTPTGIYLQGFTPGCTFQDGEVVQGVYGLYAVGTGVTVGEGPQACRFSNCFFDTQDGKEGAGSHLIDCIQMQFANCWWAGGREGGLAIEGCETIHFDGGEAYSNTTYGIRVNATCKNVTGVGTKFIQNATGLEVQAGTIEFSFADCSWRGNTTPVLIPVGSSDVYKITGLFEGNAASISDGGTGHNKCVEESFAPSAPTVTKTAGTLVTGSPGPTRQVFIVYYAKKEAKLKKVAHKFGTEMVIPEAWVWKEGKWLPFAISAWKAENIEEIEIEWTVEPYAEVAAKVLTSETKVGESKINMTGSEVAGYVNGRIAEFQIITNNVENFAIETPYFIVGASTNGFELSATFGGTAIKVAGKAITTATTKIRVLAEEIRIAVSTLGASLIEKEQVLTENIKAEAVTSAKVKKETLEPNRLEKEKLTSEQVKAEGIKPASVLLATTPTPGAEETVVAGVSGISRKITFAITGKTGFLKTKLKHSFETRALTLSAQTAATKLPAEYTAASVVTKWEAISISEVEVTFTLAAGVEAFITITG